MAVRAKFRVGRVSSVSNGRQDTPGHVIELYPVTSGSSENELFYRYTPSGKIELATVNDVAAKQFHLGAEYYVDFTLADDENDPT